MMFTPCDLSDPLDQAVIGLIVFFSLFAGLANVLNIPYFKRDGGLLSYSKFAAGVKLGITVPSKLGMTLVYFPACLVGVYAWNVTGMQLISPAVWTNRVSLVALMMVIHFGKRSLECMFLHNYSGGMPLTSSLFISSFYCILSFSNCYYAGKSHALEEPPIVAISLFLVGTSGNFYHHHLLATLRKPGDTSYKIPRGGFFEFVAAPHYFFELIGHLGVALTTVHWVSIGMLVGMTLYLVERAMAQTAWNIQKFGKFAYPTERKHIIPFLL
jgi:hypothetical protein